MDIKTLKTIFNITLGITFIIAFIFIWLNIKNDANLLFFTIFSACIIAIASFLFLWIGCNYLLGNDNFFNENEVK